MGKIPEIKKRDNELLRRILLDVQASPMHSPGRHVYIDEVPEPRVNEHLVLLQQHRLLECLVIRENDGALREVLAKQLTAEGHRFLKGAKNVSVWKKTLADAKTASFAILLKTLWERAAEAEEQEEVSP